MTEIDLLNKRLGEHLGYRNNLPRFAWKKAEDVHYYFRMENHEDFERFCWADRIGRVWVLCQWRPPVMNREEWWSSFKGAFPYPDNGMYYAHPETALPPGAQPSSALTAMHIHLLDQQMSKTLRQHEIALQNEMEARKQQEYAEWVEYVQDWNPAFSNFSTGRSGNVSFGGI